MSVDCVFCNNPAGSREHLWAAWIHKRKDFGPLKVTIGDSPSEIRNDPEQKIDTVCGKCNNGWMSALENKNKPTIACMFQDLAIPLDRQQQTALSNWSVKTAMVLDSVKGPNTNPPFQYSRFYLKSDCEQFRQQRIISDHVRIWIGRCSVSALGAYGTDVAVFSLDKSKVGIGTATTIVVGHLALQVFAMRVSPEHDGKHIDNVQPKPGDWVNLLAQIWPITRNSIMWPPQLTFTTSGPRSIAHLMDRWRIGERLSHTRLP
jgi:hypothetical protein